MRSTLRVRRHWQKILWHLNDKESVFLTFKCKSFHNPNLGRVDISAKLVFKSWQSDQQETTNLTRFEKFIRSGECLASLQMIRYDDKREFYISQLQSTVKADYTVYRLCKKEELDYFSGIGACLLYLCLEHFVPFDRKRYIVRLCALGSYISNVKRKNSELVAYYRQLGFRRLDKDCFTKIRIAKLQEDSDEEDGTRMAGAVDSVIKACSKLNKNRLIF